MRHPGELGIPEDSLVTDQTVAEVEAAFGVRLPASFIQFVRYNPEAHPLIGGVSVRDLETAIDSFFRFTADKNERFPIVACRHHPEIPEKVIPFARDAGDGLFCLDLRNGEKITFYNPDEHTWTTISDSFEEFIDGLIDLDV